MSADSSKSKDATSKDSACSAGSSHVYSAPLSGDDLSLKNDCSDPEASLVNMFVNLVQQGRIEAGQCPAMRPVFLKPHGVAHGVFKVRPGLPEHLAIGLFAGDEYPVWARFSSDTLPTVHDYTTTCGVGLKLFNTPTPKIFGQAEETTFDFILQNYPVFFVDNAKEMCEFTRAGVVDNNYDGYLAKHPKTADILNAMAQPVGSVLNISYWGILPFSLGPHQYVKYWLRPTRKDRPPRTRPVDPTYLGDEMASQLLKGAVSFEFCIQLRTNPETMPLDAATVLWPEEESPFVPVADVHFPQQEIRARGQAAYGENLSMNIWRVTEDHRPQGSIAEVRKAVYAASAEQRRTANGVPNGEPASPKPAPKLTACKDQVIVRAAIHPGIGVARIGNAETEFFIGPEVTQPSSEAPGFYRTAAGSLKRQAARFRIYGYNAAGEVVRELTSSSANIEWKVHVANHKAEWFHFITAMDIPETADLVVKRRNPELKKREERATLIIDPGERSICGSSVKGAQYRFDSGHFKGVPVNLGELQTDEEGRLLFLAGYGKSASPSGLPPYDPLDPDSFNNAPDWYDDIADGPVNAVVSINGREIPVEGAWVISAPPNYAPDVVSWRTMYDLLIDVYTQNGWLPVPETTSFTKDVLPLLQRLSNLQWVNKGFAEMFGKGAPMDFSNPDFIAKLACRPFMREDPYGELRRQLLNAFRPFQTQINEPRLWPWIYGDNYGGDLFQSSPNIMLGLPSLQQVHLQRWAAGHFENDWLSDQAEPKTLSDVPLEEQPSMLDKAALHFCLADAFHPGCEFTWPMRHASLYHKPFRIRQSAQPEEPYQWGEKLSQQQVLAPNGPLYAQVAGGLTRWMGLPWQGDTAYCRAGYDPEYDAYVPTFWPARVPNTILSEEDYQIVMDESLPRQTRLAAYHRRASWYRFIDSAGSVSAIMKQMIEHFGQQGILEARPGFVGDPDFPDVIYVENTTWAELPQQLASTLKATESSVFDIHSSEFNLRDHQLQQAGWASEKHFEDALRLRQRRPGHTE